MFAYDDTGYHEVYLRSDKALIRCRKILEDMERESRAGVSSAAAQKVA
jgi:hypothetical protein